MKRKFKIILSAATVSVLAFTALSQEVSNPSTEATDAALARMGPERVQLLKSTAKVRDVIGRTVENLQHEKLGRVNDLALDLASGRIVQVIIAAGGSLTAVPPGVLHSDLDTGTIQLDVSQEKFAAAPRFDTAQCAAGTQFNQVSAVYAYFGEEAYFATVPVADESTNENGSINALGSRTLEHVLERELARQENNPNNTITIHNPDGTTSLNYYSDKHVAIGAWSVLGQEQSARKLLGMPLRNQQGVKLGKVDNIILDLKAGRVAGIIITSGGFLGANYTLHAVKTTKLQFNPAHDGLVLDVAKRVFAHSSDYVVSEWENFPLPGYAAGSYYPYRIEPYNNNDAPNPMAVNQ